MPVIAVTADTDADVKDVVNNSQKADKNTLFCAYKGECESGEDHIKEALANGCKIVLCERRPEIKCGYILVRDAREAYAYACASLNKDPQKKLRLAAVTGTNGKTTTSTMLYHILSSLHGKAALIGGVNNIVCGKEYRSTQTTPDPSVIYKILSDAASEGAGYAVIEASSHALEYKKLTPCRFEIGAFTNLTEDHLDYHGTMDDYFEAKLKLIPLCEKFVSNGDDVYTKRINCPHFSLYDGEFTAKIKRLDRYGAEFTYDGQKSAECVIHLPGKFNVYNALTALCTAELMGEDVSDAAEALGSFKGVKGRFELHKSKYGADIIIDYAHTPDALQNALISARAICGGRLICVFGCGGDRDKGKRRLMGAVSSDLSDLTVITEDNSRSENAADIIADILKGVDKSAKYTVIKDRREAILFALGTAKQGDTVLLAGKGHEDYEINKDGTHPFSECGIINEFNCGGYVDGDHDGKRGGNSL